MSCPTQDRKIVAAIFKHLVHNDVKRFGTHFIGELNLALVDDLLDLYALHLQHRAWMP